MTITRRIALLCLFLVVLDVFSVNPATARSSTAGYPGITFKVVSPVPHGVISKRAAIHAARLQFGAQLGHKITARYGRLTVRSRPGQAHVLRNRPVWLVVGVGINERSSGPRGSRPRFHHEMNVVVDAKTGKYLFAYSYR